VFALTSGTRQGFHSHHFQYSTWNLARANRQKKEIKEIQTVKEVKLSLFCIRFYT
jgi:hypothetical protein